MAAVDLTSANLVEGVIGLVDDATETYIGETFTALSNAILPVFGSFLVLYFIFYGLAIWRGAVETPIIRFVWTVFKFSVLYGLISGFANYNTIIAQFLTNTPDAIAGIIANFPGGGTASSALGEAYNGAIDATARAFASRGVTLSFVLGVLILLTSTLMVGFSLFLITLAKIALAVLVGLGPLFIFLMMFEKTQGIFEAWLKLIINFMFITILTVAILGLTVAIAETSLTLIPENEGAFSQILSLGQVLTPAVIFVIIFLLLLQVPSIATALGGGISINIQQLGSFAAHQGSRAFGSAKKAINTRVSGGGSALAARFRNRGAISKKS